MNLFFVIKHFNLQKSFFVYLTKRLDDEFLKEMISKFLALLQQTKENYLLVRNYFFGNESKIAQLSKVGFVFYYPVILKNSAS